MNYFGSHSTRVGKPAVVCLILLALLALPATASAQKRRFEEDNHAFRFILQRLGLEPMTEPDQLNQSPENSVLIILGPTQALDTMLRNVDLMDFVAGGGAILVASDHISSPRLWEAFHVEVHGGFVRTRPELGYGPSPKEKEQDVRPECPFVKPNQSGLSETIFSGPNRLGPNRLLERLATNRPSYLEMGQTKLSILANLPEGYRIDDDGRKLPTGELPFAAGAEIGKGRVLLLSDHSIFINSMMLQPDNDNFSFAYNCVHWLSEGGKRIRVLFYDENEIVSDFKVPIKVIKEFPVPPIEVMDQLLAKLEEENIFNKLILGRDPKWMLQIILRVLAVALTLGLVLLGSYWLMQNRHRIEVKAPLFKTAERLAPAPALLTQRHQALMEQDNFWEVGRDLARDWFSDRLTQISRTPPRIIGRTSWWKRRPLEKKVNVLWKLAYGPPRRLSAQHFASVLADLAHVEAWANESLRFEE
jgi:hypothetical protein